jgi:hypothetical protein
MADQEGDMLKDIVRANPGLDRVRKDVRLLTAVPSSDYLRLRKLRAAARVRRHTYLSYARLSCLYDLAAATPGGAYVECGVWRGGSAGMVGLADPSREMWLFDSWQGLPEPGPEDVAVQGHRRSKGWNYATQEEADELLFAQLGLARERVRLVPGWYEDTLPKVAPTLGPISLLHVDCDWYESVRCVLGHLYDLVVGTVVVDDYYHWQGCRMAVDEFLADRPAVELRRIDADGVYWHVPPPQR